jgi:hypothetical protein
MRVPQVSERIKEAPAQALRGVFAGIGQLLLITDKLRNKPPGSQQVPRARAPEPPATAAGASRDEASAPVQAKAQPVSDVKLIPGTQQVPEAAKSPRAPRAANVDEVRDLDKSGNVRLLGSAEGAAAKASSGKNAGSTGQRGRSARIAGAGKAPGAEEAAGAGEAAGAAEAPETREARVAPGAGEAAAPLPNYDELSVASLRARLRYLDVGQLRQLADYEKAHADRAEVITMFERRIGKLESQTEARGEAEAEAEVEAQEEVEAEVRADVAAEAEAET